MSHITIIISSVPDASDNLREQVTYEYRVPVPHNATPAQVGEIAKKAYKRLEGNSDHDHDD